MDIGNPIDSESTQAQAVGLYFDHKGLIVDQPPKKIHDHDFRYSVSGVSLTNEAWLSYAGTGPRERKDWVDTISAAAERFRLNRDRATKKYDKCFFCGDDNPDHPGRDCTRNPNKPQRFTSWAQKLLNVERQVNELKNSSAKDLPPQMPPVVANIHESNLRATAVYDCRLSGAVSLEELIRQSVQNNVIILLPPGLLAPRAQDAGPKDHNGGSQKGSNDPFSGGGSQ